MQIPTDLAAWPTHEVQEWFALLHDDPDLTEEEFAAAAVAVREVILGRTTRYAYLVERVDADDTPADRRALRGGTREVTDDWDSRALAEELAREVRVAHSYYAGQIRVTVWPHQDDRPHPIVTHQAPPAGAERFEYGKPV